MRGGGEDSETSTESVPRKARVRLGSEHSNENLKRSGSLRLCMDGKIQKRRADAAGTGSGRSGGVPMRNIEIVVKDTGLKQEPIDHNSKLGRAPDRSLSIERTDNKQEPNQIKLHIVLIYLNFSLIYSIILFDYLKFYIFIFI